MMEFENWLKTHSLCSRILKVHIYIYGFRLKEVAIGKDVYHNFIVHSSKHPRRSNTMGVNGRDQPYQPSNLLTIPRPPQ